MGDDDNRSDTSEDTVINGDLFTEPADYAPAPKPTQQTYTLVSGQTLTLHLIATHSLWGHLLWNGGRLVARWLEEHAETEVGGRDVLELGAGSGLPSLVAASCGARKVVVTDYPDESLLANLRRNIQEAKETLDGDTGGSKLDGMGVRGHAWGGEVEDLLKFLRDESEDGEKEKIFSGNEGGNITKEENDRTSQSESEKKFDLVILADLIFNHSYHSHLLRTVERTLAKHADAKALVFFTSYRPWLAHKDMAFFDMARECGFEVEQIVEIMLEKPMFEDDPGDIEVQKKCTGWVVRWSEGACEGCRGAGK